ncbi:MAG: hypothetical protein IPL46_15965 [Saprospiraceae bacterium]|nr:hypothetical protein [Saprospiraceae bacterium]
MNHGYYLKAPRKRKYTTAIGSGIFILLVLFNACNLVTVKKSLTREDIIPLTKHWEIAIAHQEIPDGLSSISAASCGSCHQEIYKDWKQSTHSVAFQDLQFQAEWKKMISLLASIVILLAKPAGIYSQRPY